MFTDVVFAALITVIGSVVTFILAEVFSRNRVKSERDFSWARHLMEKRLSFYEQTLSQLAPEKLPLLQAEDLSFDSLYLLFTEFLVHVGVTVSMSRLYAGSQVVASLESLQELVRNFTSRLVSRKEGTGMEREAIAFVDDFRVGYDSLVRAVRLEAGSDALKPLVKDGSKKSSHKGRGNKPRNDDGKI